MKKPKIQFVEDTPSHLAAFLYAIADLEDLLPAHAAFLMAQQPPEAERVPDEETIFLRAGLALLCAAWEACLEDLALSGIEFVLQNCTDPGTLPLGVKKVTAKHIKNDTHELAAWKMAGAGWQAVTRQIAKNAVEALNTPYPWNIDDLFEELFGIKKVCNCWEWENFENKFVRETIIRLVRERGAIAHGRKPSLPLSANLLVYWRQFVVECAFRLHNKVMEDLSKVCGDAHFVMMRQDFDWTKYLKLRTKADEPPAAGTEGIGERPK